MKADIRHLRQSKGMTQKGLADALGVTIGTVVNYEKQLSHPPYDKRKKLAKIFSVDETEFAKK